MLRPKLVSVAYKAGLSAALVANIKYMLCLLMDGQVAHLKKKKV